MEAQKAAGWGSLDMTMIYTQTEAQREREHVEKILDRLGVAKKVSAKEELQNISVLSSVQ